MELICTNSKHDSEMKPTSLNLVIPFRTNSWTGFPISYFRNDKKKKNWSRNVSRNCFWDRYWGRASQLLASFFPVPGNSPRSLYES